MQMKNKKEGLKCCAEAAEDKASEVKERMSITAKELDE